MPALESLWTEVPGGVMHARTVSTALIRRRSCLYKRHLILPILTPQPPCSGPLANYLRGEDFPLLGTTPRWAAPLMKLFTSLVNRLPQRLQEQIYIWSGRYEAITPEQLPSTQAERVAEWMVSLYPAQQYPAVAVGSANGAAVHLWAALGIPWLSQTFLIPVARSGIPPDDPQADEHWAQGPARVFLQANPGVQLHHMHDPNQDRLMIHEDDLLLGQAPVARGRL